MMEDLILGNNIFSQVDLTERTEIDNMISNQINLNVLNKIKTGLYMMGSCSSSFIESLYIPGVDLIEFSERPVALSHEDITTGLNVLLDNFNTLIMMNSLDYIALVLPNIKHHLYHLDFVFPCKNTLAEDVIWIIKQKLLAIISGKFRVQRIADSESVPYKISIRFKPCFWQHLYPDNETFSKFLKLYADYLMELEKSGISVYTQFDRDIVDNYKPLITYSTNFTPNELIFMANNARN